MKAIIITALIILGIGTYPGYAHRIVSAAEEIVCKVIPAQYQPAVMFVVIVVAIVAIAQVENRKG